MRYLHSFLPFGIAALLISGCGGGAGRAARGPSRSGGLTTTIQWPGRGRLIPAASSSIRIDVGIGATALATKTVDRPATVSTTTVTFGSLPPGSVWVKGTAFPQAGGAGVAQATSRLTWVTVEDGQDTAFTLTMSSTVRSCVVTPKDPSMKVGETLQLTATAKDANGSVVLVGSRAWTWVSIVFGSEVVATVDDLGRVTALAPGTATITANETEAQRDSLEMPVEDHVTVTVSP